MTWRELFARRPKWWVALTERIRLAADSADDDPQSDEPQHRRTSVEQARFWAEFRAGQLEADERARSDRKLET